MAKNERIEINNIFYHYRAGNMFIEIWTGVKDQWAVVPQWVRVEFVIERPEQWETIPKVVEKAIRAKVAEQRKLATVKQ